MLKSKKNILPLDMSPPQAILFDWDNTLLDAWPILHASMNAAQTVMGVPRWTLAEAKANIRKPPRHYFSETFGDQAHHAEKIFYAHYLAHHHQHLNPMPGAEALLHFLKDSAIPTGVVSNKTGYILRKEVETLKWDSFFSAVVGSSDALHDKPARDPVDLALQASSFVAGPHVWFIGDTDIDMECAHGAGCTPIFLGDNTTDEAMALWPAKVYVDSCDDLQRLLQELLT